MTLNTFAFKPVEVAGLSIPVAAATDVVFGRGGERDLRLDLYRPAAGTEFPLPAVVFIHGGGWHGGDKADYRDLAARITARGYLCASVDYRLSGEALFPAALEDCKAAVRWLRAHSAAIRAAPRYVAAWGHSAGGHLAAMLALTPGRFEGAGGSAHAASGVQCALCFSTPFDLAALVPSLGASLEQFLGSTAVERAAILAQASPLSYAPGSTTPFFVCHGDQDDLVPVAQSDRFVAAVRTAEAPVEFVRVPGAGHDLERHSEDILARALRFLDTHLKQPPR